MAQKPKEFVLVIWEDPASEWPGWVERDKLESTKMVEVYSIGWLAREDEHYVYLAMDYEDDNVNTLGKIPKTAVKHLTKRKLRGFPGKDSGYDSRV